MEREKLQFWRWRKQALDGLLVGRKASDILSATGWMRSVGGSGPYLGLWNRARLTREQVDEAVAQLEIHELPSARGCTYVVPAEDFALALTLARQSSDAEMNVARKLGVTDAEIDRLIEAVLKALESGPLDPEGIRAAVGNAARSLGEAGKKKGLSTTLPLALGKLQDDGAIRRVPVGGRLDQQRYKYTLWKPNPLAQSRLSVEESWAALGARYFRWIGPASLTEWQWFSGLSKKNASAAIASLNLVEFGDELIGYAQDLEEFKKLPVPKKPDYALVADLDSIFALRRNVAEFLTADDQEREVLIDRGKSSKLGSVSDMPANAILDRGRVVGLWLFDTEQNAIVAQPFGKPDAALKAAIARTQEYVREQLGDARSFSLDSPKSRAPRVAALRACASGSS